MKKLLTVIASIALISGVFSAQAIGHGGGKGDDNGLKWGHGKRGAQVWRAHLTAPTAPTGPTASVARKRFGATGPTGSSDTGPRGKFTLVQNRKWYLWGLKAKGLTASATYTVAVAVDPTATTSKKAKTSHHPAGPSGSTGSTGPVGKNTLPATVTVSEKGWVITGGKGLRADLGLDKTKAYLVTITDSSGAVVLQGRLLRKTHHSHRGCSGYSTTGSGAHKKRHNR